VSKIINKDDTSRAHSEFKQAVMVPEGGCCVPGCGRGAGWHRYLDRRDHGILGVWLHSFLLSSFLECLSFGTNHYLSLVCCAAIPVRGKILWDAKYATYELITS
jgi:hypothetical protein